MNWKHFLLAILAASVASSFTDWLFAACFFTKVPRVSRSLA